MDWDIEQIATLCMTIQQIPAPTFGEHARAEFVAARLRDAGLRDVETDDTPNVYARVPGQTDGNGKGLLVSAHLDTVFPPDADLTNRREGDRLFGPGICDNSMGVAGLVTLAERLAQTEPPPSDVWFVGNAGEEGLGDLKGMRRALDRLDVKGCIVLEGGSGHPWTITHRGLGVRRYKIEARTQGGHSWGAFGEPSAIHQLVRLADLITRWQVPKSPRTTFNIGVIEGGTSVNTIAAYAALLLDLRSEDRAELDKLIARTEELVAAANAIGEARFTATIVGDRPTGAIPITHPLVVAASDIYRELGVADANIRYRIGSTDANIPLSRGVPAVTLYLTQGHGAHRMDEWLSLEPLPLGLTAAWRLIQWAVGNLP